MTNGHELNRRIKGRAPDDVRGTGRTARQIENAPRAAFFVVREREALNYVRELAKALGRGDIKIIERERAYTIRGVARPIVVDHAAESALTEDERRTIEGHHVWFKSRNLPAMT